jgi:hypothetical protein
MQNVTNARNLPRHGLDAATGLAQQVTAYNLVYSNLEQASEWVKEKLKVEGSKLKVEGLKVAKKPYPSTR